MTVSKTIHIGLIRVQLLGRIFLTPRGWEIQALFAKEPRISVREAYELAHELELLVLDENQRDTAAALTRGDFAREPPAQTWPTTRPLARQTAVKTAATAVGDGLCGTFGGIDRPLSPPE